jgi:hypothetical protein
MNPFAFVGDKAQDFWIWAFNLMGEYPMVTGAIFCWEAFCFLSVCIVRGLYPSSKWKKDDRPALARILLLICDPFVGNVWSIFEWMFAKLGIKLPTPPPLQDLSATLSIPTGK